MQPSATLYERKTRFQSLNSSVWRDMGQNPFWENGTVN